MRIANKFGREMNVRMLVNVCRGWEPVGTMAWIEGELEAGHRHHLSNTKLPDLVNTRHQISEKEQNPIEVNQKNTYLTPETGSQLKEQNIPVGGEELQIPKSCTRLTY